MKIFVFLAFFLINGCHPKGSNSLVKENQTLTIVAKPFVELADNIKESSGLEFIDGELFTINDSGGGNDLYILDQDGNSQKKVEVKDSKNQDWESLASYKSTLYVGDFGNNLGNRKDLKVYAVNEWKGDKANSDKIKFTYQNQSDFRNQNHSHSFDCEAMIAFEDELILFSKDWLNHTTEVYHLPINFEEEQTISSIEKMDVNTLITGADYNSETKTLVLSGYLDYNMYIWVFKGASHSKMLTDNHQKYEIEGLKNAQVEGIAFIDNNSVLISTERTKDFEQQLWKVELP